MAPRNPFDLPHFHTRIHVAALVVLTTLTTSGKLFDSTSTGKIPGCPHSIQHISLIVSKLIHFETAGEILRLHFQPFTTAFHIRDISHV